MTPEYYREYSRRYRQAHRLELALKRVERWHRDPEASRSAGRAYRVSETGKAAKRRAYERDLANGKAKARGAVSTALHNGTLVREACARCGAKETQAHHYLGYAPEHHLRVTWLCILHHEAAHHLVSALRLAVA